MTKAAIKFNGTMGTPSILADDSLRINVTSSSVTNDEDFLEFMKLRRARVNVFIKPADDKITKLVEIDGIKKKTPSQRLRSALYLLWVQDGWPGDKEAYYLAEMEKIIKEKTNKLD
jgi:hypothetical protein